MHLDFAQHELIEHLRLEDGHRRQRPALLQRLLLLLRPQVLHDEIDPIGELALEHDAFLDDGGNAIQQLAARAEIAVLRERARDEYGRREGRNDRGADQGAERETIELEE